MLVIGKWQGQQFLVAHQESVILSFIYFAPASHLSFDYLSSGRFYCTRPVCKEPSAWLIAVCVCVQVSHAVNTASLARKETFLLLSFLCVWAQATHQSCGGAERAQIWPYLARKPNLASQSAHSKGDQTEKWSFSFHPLALADARLEFAITRRTHLKWAHTQSWADAGTSFAPVCRPGLHYMVSCAFLFR